jgi:hypothetical protein
MTRETLDFIRRLVVAHRARTLTRLMGYVPPSCRKRYEIDLARCDVALSMLDFAEAAQDDGGE